MWQVEYAVFDGGVIIDAEISASLTDEAIVEALGAVTITGSTETYASLAVDIEIVTPGVAIEESHMFTFMMSGEIDVSLYATMEATLALLYQSDLDGKSK